MVLVAASNSDLRKLINKVREHANLNQYTSSLSRRASAWYLGTIIDQDLAALHGRLHRPAHEAHTDRYTYVGLELHEMLGAYKGALLAS